MNALLERSILRDSRYRNAKGAIDVSGICSLLELDQATLARAVGVSRQAISQQLSEKGKFVQPRNEVSRKFFDELNQIVTLLGALTDESNTDEEIRRWLHSPNRALKLRPPIELIKARKFAPLKEILMDALTAAQGG